MAQNETSRREAQPHPFIKGVHGVRYQVKDVARSVAFYTGHLGFRLEHQQLPAFANVSLGDAQILLSGPGASGSRPMPNGQRQEPGGWNRVVLSVIFDSRPRSGREARRRNSTSQDWPLPFCGAPVTSMNTSATNGSASRIFRSSSSIARPSSSIFSFGDGRALARTTTSSGPE